MTVKAVIFDIGGVVVNSPLLGADNYCEQHGLPQNYINAAITATGRQGAFQRLERGELKVGPEFYEAFGKGLSNVELANAAYKRYCDKTGRKCPPLPTKLEIDGQELWTTMMVQALTVDRVIFEAIVRLRRSKEVKVAALTNNFEPVDSKRKAGQAHTAFAAESLPTYDQVQDQILDDAARNPSGSGSGASLKGLFDYFIESAVEGVRKPDPKIFELTLERIGVKADEAAFLDDIGLNLVSARKLGIHTIRVNPGKSREAVAELEKLTGLALLEAGGAKL